MPGRTRHRIFYGAETRESAEAIKQFTGGLGQVSEVVPLVEYLVNPSATWMSGQTLFINGGFATR